MESLTKPHWKGPVWFANWFAPVGISHMGHDVSIMEAFISDVRGETRRCGNGALRTRVTAPVA